MGNKTYNLKFRAINKDTFEAIRRGDKKIETRAATEKYRDIKPGDSITFICGKRRYKKVVKKVEVFKSIAAILKKYTPRAINPNTRTASEAREMGYSFPGYREKIRKHGLIVLRLE
ncbi:MAG: hypothetical protein HY457_03255 [Parcubacteria group bacterium]|nr:hypothetical protein [Parcubacteria group bacterium]